MPRCPGPCCSPGRWAGTPSWTACPARATFAPGPATRTRRAAARRGGPARARPRARHRVLSRRVLKSLFGFFNRAPLGNVNLTALLSVSAKHSIPSWDHTGTPSGLDGFFHFTSSMASESACLIKARSRDNVSPRQSPGILILSVYLLNSRLAFHAHLFLLQLLQQLTILHVRVPDLSRASAMASRSMSPESLNLGPGRKLARKVRARDRRACQARGAIVALAAQPGLDAREGNGARWS